MKKKTTQYKLPKQYTVGGQLVDIQQVDQICDGLLGQCSLAEGWIKIANKHGTSIQSDTSKLNTMYHEIVHSILDTMGERELSSNEKFVNTFAGFLTEVLTTLK